MEIVVIMKKPQNKIEKLISELCPKGVESVALKNVTRAETSRNINQSLTEVRSVTNRAGLVRTSDFFDNTRTSEDTSNYKIVKPNMFVYNPSRINVGSMAFNKENIPIIVSPMYVVVDIDKEKIELSYLEVFLSSGKGKQMIFNKVEPGARFRLTYDSFASIVIPLPPIQIQKEIVKILDNFTELEAELEAELESRKKQYEYYQDNLLTFKSVDFLEIKDLSSETFWIMPATPKFIPDEGIPYITSKNIKGGHINFGNIKNISKESYLEISKNRPILEDDILIGMIGTIGQVTRVKQSDLDFYGQNMYLLRLDQDKINVSYFLHYFDSKKIKNYFTSIKNGSAQGYLKAGQVESIKIPVPPIEEQKRIVSILDKFDTLVNDISVGLPAELKARRSQYEYYRSQLLTFPELKSNEHAK